MKNIFIPEDIKRYVKKKVISCVLYFILLELLAVVINVWIFTPLSSRLDTWLHILIIILLQIVPFIISKFPFKLMDRSWCGEVISVDIETKTGAYTAGGTKTAPYTKHEIMLGIALQNGENIKIKVREVGERPHLPSLKGFAVPNEGDIKQFINYYSIGDKVYHFYGLENYYVIKKNSDMTDCVMCGAQNPIDRTDCFGCGHTLIKID